LHPLEQGEYSFDSNSVIDFFKTATLPLLDSLFAGRALLSDFVVRELADAQIEWRQAQVIPLSTEPELQLFDDIRRNNRALGSGEVGAITIAKLRRAGLISNDRQARNAATELNIPVSGSLGILNYSVQVGQISGEEAVRILTQMILAGAWLSEELVEQFRRDVLKN